MRRKRNDGAAGADAPATAPGDETPAAPPRGRRRRTGWRRLVPTWRFCVGSLLVAVIIGCGALIAGYLVATIPPPNKAAAAQANVYLYADGSQIARSGDINREKVELSQVPEHTQEAVMAAEDRNFYSESAVDLSAMVRAGWNMLTGGARQSGSTITQQYVKNYYLEPEQTVTRKTKEFFISLKLDSEVSKREILRGYLNTSYFGRNAYGIQSAAHAYYGKDVKDLTTAEGAYLAALLKAPSAYDVSAPANRPRALARWNYVLDGMISEGWLTRAERARLTFPEPDPQRPATNLSGQRGYLVEAVNTYLLTNGVTDQRTIDGGGLRIVTTLQPERQKALRDAVREQLTSQLSEDREVDAYVRAGGTSIDPETGEVVAMYGGRDFTEQYVNNATRRDYQVGSTFKPFVFAAAVSNAARTQGGKAIRPETVYDGTNKRQVVSGGVPTSYNPANQDDRSYGKITVSEAMDKSVNAVFAQMGVDVGPETVKDTAISLGLPADTPNLTADASVALGVTTASTLDMAEAYATLANHGRHTPHRLVKEITHLGDPLDLPDRDSTQAVPRTAADATTDILTGVVEGGSGTAAQSAGRPAAGKTGTAEEDRAAWFAGYTPQLSTVIAVMGQNPDGEQEPLYGAGGLARVNGGGFPAQIWGQYTAAALEGEPVLAFDLQTGGMDADASPSPSETGEDGEDGGPEGEDGSSEFPQDTDGTQDAGGEPGGTGGTGGDEGGQDTGDGDTGDGDTGDNAGEDLGGTDGGGDTGTGSGDEADPGQDLGGTGDGREALNGGRLLRGGSPTGQEPDRTPDGTPGSGSLPEPDPVEE